MAKSARFARNDNTGVMQRSLFFATTNLIFRIIIYSNYTSRAKSDKEIKCISKKMWQKMEVVALFNPEYPVDPVKKGYYLSLCLVKRSLDKIFEQRMRVHWA